MHKNTKIKIFIYFLLLPSLGYSYNISLKKGWNLMGFNEEINASKLLSSNAHISSLWAYDRDTLSWVYINKSSKKNNKELVKSSANEGMWITVDADVIINVEGSFISNQKNTNKRNYVKRNMTVHNRSYSGVRGR